MTGDATAVAAWHIMSKFPASIRSDEWEPLVTGFVAQELADGGAAVAWAIHALQGIDEWIVKPHAPLIVTARGQRCPAWIGSRQAQRRLELALRRRCAADRLMGANQSNVAAA